MNNLQQSKSEMTNDRLQQGGEELKHIDDVVN
jgi:hypothetical protein